MPLLQLLHRVFLGIGKIQRTLPNTSRCKEEVGILDLLAIVECHISVGLVVLVVVNRIDLGINRPLVPFIESGGEGQKYFVLVVRLGFAHDEPASRGEMNEMGTGINEDELGGLWVDALCELVEGRNARKARSDDDDGFGGGHGTGDLVVGSVGVGSLSDKIPGELMDNQNL